MTTKVKVLKGSKLHFISVIHRDGSGTTNVENDDMSHYYNDDFKMSCLSISKGTYIASEMNSYVVKLKKEDVIPKIEHGENCKDLLKCCDKCKSDFIEYIENKGGN